ncbi:hypothetical protein B0H13DRAFT_2391333 [Mycena leptocephala]|nr:hypothetical protein B0H13DRAFT_2391333 [Mycena leptocephala]
MPTVSSCQNLIPTVALQAEQDTDDYFEEELNDSDMDLDLGLDHDSDMNNSDSDTSGTSSTSSDSSTSSSSSSDSSGSDCSMPGIISDDGEMMGVISRTRVLNLNTVAKVSQLHLVLVEFKNYDPKRFRCNLRISPETFDELVEKIENHPVFSNNSYCEQTNVSIHLAITLFRFGHDGNAASVESIAQWAGISAGLVAKSTQRVIVVFLALHDEVICWPTEAEKEEAKAWVAAASCEDWAGGFCMVDSTLVPLFEKPGHHGEVYFDRKSN